MRVRSCASFPQSRIKMKLSFAWKLGIIVTLLSVTVTSICVYSFYVISYRTVMTQIGKNLLHVGRLGVSMLDDEARAAIKRLTQATAEDAIVNADDIARMQPRTTLLSLSREDIDRYHASKDFQLLLDVLSRVSFATFQDMEPKKKSYRLEEPLKAISNGVFGTYIAVPIKESPNLEVMKYLASAAPLPTADGWPGNPIGNLAKGWEPLDYLLKGTSYVDDRLYTDEFYTSLSAAVPILDKDGSTFAILGIDYAATEERNQLIVLKFFCYGLVLASLLLSIVSSYFMAHKLSSSLRILSDAARRVADNDFSISLDIKSNDEFAILGKVFNQMILGIRKYTLALEEKNNQLATIVYDMHDGIGAILTSIAMNSEKDALRVGKEAEQRRADTLMSINHLAREGLTEVRFLMNAVEYDKCDFPVIIEEIRMQSVDILAPSGIQFDLQITGDLPPNPLDFGKYLELQRIFREVFVNIVKHANATKCTVKIVFSSAEVAMKISDNGGRENETMSIGGRGLKSLLARAKQLGGRLEYCRQDGFHIELNMPLPLSCPANENIAEDDACNKSVL